MRWETVKLYKRVKSGTDKLGNATHNNTFVRACDGRVTPWTFEEISIDRTVTKMELKVLLKLPFEYYPFADEIEIKGVTYEVTKEEAMGTRFTLLHVKDYKNVKK